jgi:Mor family transcriptional regulator
MALKKVTNVEKPKRKIIMTMVELKKELIIKWEKGTHVSDLAIQYGMAKSTISTILKNREAINAADVAKGVKSLRIE